MQLIEEAKQICQQRQKLLEQQQYGLAVKTINVEEALLKGEGVLGQHARSPATGKYKSGFVIIIFSIFVIEELVDIFPSLDACLFHVLIYVDGLFVVCVFLLIQCIFLHCV